jgi:hypothetical protein
MALLSAMWSLGQRGRHHRTILILDLAVKSVPCRSSFVAEVQMIVLLGQPAHQLARGRRRVLELTQVAHFAATSASATAFFAFEVSRPIKASPYPDMARPLYMEARLGLPPRPFLYMGDEPPHLFSGHTVLPVPPAGASPGAHKQTLRPCWSRPRALAGHRLADRAQRPRQCCQDSHAAQPKTTKAMPVTIAIAFKAQLSGVTPRAVRGVMKASGLIAN